MGQRGEREREKRGEIEKEEERTVKEMGRDREERDVRGGEEEEGGDEEERGGGGRREESSKLHAT